MVAAGGRREKRLLENTGRGLKYWFYYSKGLACEEPRALRSYVTGSRLVVLGRISKKRQPTLINIHELSLYSLIRIAVGGDICTHRKFLLEKHTPLNMYGPTWALFILLKGIVHFEIKIWYLSAYPKGIQDVGVFFSSVDPILMFLGQTVLVCQSYNGRYRSLSQ